MKKASPYWRFSVVCILLFCLFLCPSRTSAQAIEAGYGKGKVLKFDQWLNKEGALKQQESQSFWMGYTYQTHAKEHCDYAADYNYPTFTFGLLVADFNKVRLRYDPYGTRPINYNSRCGTSYVLYGAFRRAFFAQNRDGVPTTLSAMASDTTPTSTTDTTM